MGTGDRRGRIYPRAQNTAHCMGRLFKQRPPCSVIDTGLQRQLPNFRIAESIKETLGKRLKIGHNENVVTVAEDCLSSDAPSR